MYISNLHYIGTEFQQIEIVEKTWGEEHVICRTPHAAKIMKLKPGSQVSLHWHHDKTESFILVRGELIVELVTKAGQREVVRLTDPLSSITIPNMMPHTFYCPDDQTGESIFIEASTMDDPNDSYRLFPSGPKGEGLHNWRSADR